MLQNFIPYSTQSINQDDQNAVLEALNSTHLTQGKYTKEFEQAIANYTNTQYAISFNSATSALYTAFHSIKQYVSNGVFQERFHNAKNFSYARNNKTISIITTPISFVATTNMMLAHNIVPIFADITMDGNLKLGNIESLLREDTVAICSVDYAGKSVNAQNFQDFAKKHNLLWISDSSHTFGGMFDGKKVGEFADMSIFSFHAVKPLTTCEGGALVCNDSYFAKNAALICSHGIEKKSFYDHDCIDLGFNFRLSEIGANLGLSQLKRLENFLQKREEIANFYNSYFNNNPYFTIPLIPTNTKSTRHLYPILLNEQLSVKKGKIIDDLINKNIGVQVHYKPIYHFTLYKQFNIKPLETAERFYQQELSIPCHQNMTLDIAKQIADILLSTLQSHMK